MARILIIVAGMLLMSACASTASNPASSTPSSNDELEICKMMPLGPSKSNPKIMVVLMNCKTHHPDTKVQPSSSNPDELYVER